MAKPATLVSFTKEEMLSELRGLLYKYVAISYVFAGSTRVASMLAGSKIKEADADNLGYPDFGPEDAGLDTDDWPVIEIFDVMYDFAVDGVARDAPGNMGDETPYTYCANFVFDLGRSFALRELFDVQGHRVWPEMCVHIIQLASARLALEGYERFTTLDSKDQDYIDLSVREIALLAGMEETSVRNAANPKKPNPLKTYQEDGRTLVKPDDAKSWLKARGKYTPLAYNRSEDEIDLATHSFKGGFELWGYIERKARKKEKSLSELGEMIGSPHLHDEAWGTAEVFELTDDQRERLGRELDVDPKLFALRLKELELVVQRNRLLEEIEAAAAAAGGA